ncbi:organic solvent tolerance protein [Candidatus Pelagibacter sp.]|nr:organic solvent tolerance protein [Candidatus Pelagibacter sp.]
MRNNFLSFLIFLIVSKLFFFSVNSAEQFNFDITEIEILQNGDVIKGIKKGTVNTNDGIKITADTFVYQKLLNILSAEGNVIIKDSKKNLEIYSNNVVYEKNKEIITTNKNSKVIYGVGKSILADSFKLDRKKNILDANGNVKIKNTLDDYLITGNNFSYIKDSEKIISKGKTEAFLQSKYTITSEDVIYQIDENNLSSVKKTKIEDDNSQVYFTENFNYSINQEIFKGEKILIITNYNLPKSEKVYFENAIINLAEQKFIAKDTKIDLSKDIFDNSENDPRLKGVSSISDSNTTIIKKGVFTSCKKNDDCPPWSIYAGEIKHNKMKKQLIYKDAVLKIYDLPILYFPKFFHPDPSVKRQSGILQPEINSSNNLGNSVTLPYFKVISNNKDLTLNPTLFDDNTSMLTTEYRVINEKNKILADIGYVNGYKSTTTNKKSSLSHYFLDIDHDLQLEDFDSSNLKLSIKKISNDTYLKIFDQHITKSSLRPENFDNLNSSLKLFLNNEDFIFETGIQSFEDLQIENKSDRYQYNLPYYNYDKLVEQNYFDGTIDFNSNGNNYLSETNKLETNIVNNLIYNSTGYISDFGLKNNFSLSLKNLNSIGKKTSQYKSNPQMEIVSMFNVDFSMPLERKSNNSNNMLIPKISFRFNPSDMKNYSSSENKIDAGNVFALNRLGLSDTLETGKSITLGLDYNNEKKNNLDQINNYFELKVATVFRDKEENFIPNKSTINKKNSNLFGSISNKFSDNVNIGYDFSIDNDYSTFEYNDLNATISVNNFITKFNFIEEHGDTGDTNIFASSFEYNFDKKNSFKFQTRRNRKLSLTEYYDLVYEYKNDCLTAGIKYKKSYYADNDLKPTENLLFTISLFPLTSYEYSANDLISQ